MFLNRERERQRIQALPTDRLRREASRNEFLFDTQMALNILLVAGSLGLLRLATESIISKDATGGLLTLQAIAAIVNNFYSLEFITPRAVLYEQATRTRGITPEYGVFIGNTKRIGHFVRRITHRQ